MGETLRIYPTRLRIEDELSKSGFAQGVIFTDSMMSFGELEEKLADELVKLKPVDEITRWLFLHDAAVRASAGNPQISALVDTEGFVRSTGELVNQVKLGLVGGGELEKIRGYAPGKEEWLRKVFDRYNGLLRKTGLPDSADITNLLLEKLAKSKTPPAFLAKFDEIRIHDVYHFTPARFELIRLLGRRLRVALHFPLPDGRRKAFDFVERDIQKFQSLGEDAGMLELSFDEPSRGDNPLGLFVETLFSEAGREQIDNLHSRVEIYKNSGRYREIEEVAEKILALADGEPLSEFCVVFRDLEKYGSIVEDVFRRAGIPVYLRRGIPARSNPYVKSLLGIFEVLEKDLERDEVAKLASSQYFSFLPKGTEGYEADRLLIKAGVTNGPHSTWRHKLSALKLSGKENALSLKILKLTSLLEKLGKAGTAGSCVSAFNAVVNLLEPLAMNPARAHFLRDAFCKTRFDEIIAELQTALDSAGMGDARFQWRDLRRLLLNSLGNMNTPRWSAGDHVYALNVHELAGRRFKTVFICGLHDGEFPARIQRGSILAESEKKEFNKIHAETLFSQKPWLARGRAVFSHLGESWEEESFIFYLSARAATERLVLSTSAADLDGRELLLSPFLEEIMDTHPQLAANVTPAVAMEKKFEEQIDSGARRAKMLGSLFGPAEKADELRPYFRELSTSGEFMLSCEKSRIELERARFYGEYDPARRASASDRFTGRLADAPALALFFRDEIKRDFSASALERYGKCPFRYLMYYVLKCEAVRMPTAEAEKTFDGKVIHSVLENYYDHAKAVFSPPAERTKRMGDSMESVFAYYQKKGIEGEPELWKITKRRLEASLKMFVEWEGEYYEDEPFVPVESEFPFGGKKGEPLEINEDGKKVRLNGFIDRVDYIPAKKLLRVVDYKYSNPSRFPKLLRPELFFVESFQAPIYLYAALMNLKKPGEVVGAYAEYISLKKGAKATKHTESAFDSVCGADSLKSLEGSEEFGKKILGIVGRMESGDFSVSPLDCVFCRYRRACRYVEVRESALDE